MMKMKDIFIMSIKIGALTFGGGYAMLPILQREAIDKRHLITEAEALEYYALSQCVPGLIMVNTLTLIGRKVGGKIGGLVAALGSILPSFIIILAIAAFFQGISDNVFVQWAFDGIRVAVVVLVLNSLISLVKVSVTNFITGLIFVATATLATIYKVNPVIYVVCGGLIGLIYSLIYTKGEDV